MKMKKIILWFILFLFVWLSEVYAIEESISTSNIWEFIIQDWGISDWITKIVDLKYRTDSSIWIDLYTIDWIELESIYVNTNDWYTWYYWYISLWSWKYAIMYRAANNFFVAVLDSSTNSLIFNQNMSWDLNGFVMFLYWDYLFFHNQNIYVWYSLSDWSINTWDWYDESWFLTTFWIDYSEMSIPWDTINIESELLSNYTLSNYTLFFTDLIDSIWTLTVSWNTNRSVRTDDLVVYSTFWDYSKFHIPSLDISNDSINFFHSQQNQWTTFYKYNYLDKTVSTVLSQDDKYYIGTSSGELIYLDSNSVAWNLYSNKKEWFIWFYNDSIAYTKDWSTDWFIDWDIVPYIWDDNYWEIDDSGNYISSWVWDAYDNSIISSSDWKIYSSDCKVPTTNFWNLEISIFWIAPVQPFAAFNCLFGVIFYYIVPIDDWWFGTYFNVDTWVNRLIIDPTVEASIEKRLFQDLELWDFFVLLAFISFIMKIFDIQLWASDFWDTRTSKNIRHKNAISADNLAKAKDKYNTKT